MKVNLLLRHSYWYSELTISVSDEGSFGSRMLAKMGWTKGKGLGANENGKQDFVRLRYKNDIGG